MSAGSRRAGESMAWVTAQAALFLGVALAPGKPFRPTAMGAVLFGGGAALIGWSALTLGTSLSPFPAPRTRGHFTPAGPYRWVRHPMYVGVVVASLGYAAATASPARAGLSALAGLFFDAKARHEERLLADRYPDYPAYRRATRKFVPFCY